MLTRLINIVLIFSVLTVLSGSTICASHCEMQQRVASNCCSAPVEKSDEAACCIAPAGTFALSTEKFLLPDAHSYPLPLFFAETFIFSFKPTVLSFEHRWFNYKAPSITRDLSLLNEVFRI